MKDRMITSPTAKEMLSSILPIYHHDAYMLHIFAANGKELDDLWKTVKSVREQVYPQFASWSLSYWEQWLGLSNGKGLSIEERRKRIIVFLNTYFPVNKERVEMVASAAAGVKVTIEENIDDYVFRINLNKAAENVDFPKLIHEVNKIKPAHLGYRITQHLSGKMHLASAMLFGEEVTVYPWRNTKLETKGYARFGTASRSLETISIYPLSS